MLDLTKILTYDSETWLIQPGRLAPKLVLGSFHRSDTGQSWLEPAASVLDQLDYWLGLDDWRIAGHNLCFDLAVVLATDPSYARLLWLFWLYENNKVLDTLVIEKLRAIAEDYMKFDCRSGQPKKTRFSLEYVVEAYFGEKVEGKYGPDVWRTRFHELDGLPLDRMPAEAKVYALKDAELAARVVQQQLQAFWSPDLFNQMRASWSMHLMALHGMRTDATAVDILDAYTEERITKEMTRLVDAGIYRKQGKKVVKLVKNTKEIKDRITTAAHLRGEEPERTAPSERYPEGQISTARKYLIASEDPDLIALAEIGPFQKVRTTYLPVLREGTVLPINASWNVLVESGRTSCAKPNLQNLMRMMLLRECFVPRKGNIFVGCDYHTAELRSLAQVLTTLFPGQIIEMAESLKHGRELHLEMGAAILGIPYEEAIARKKDKPVKDARQLAKAANFGLPGGLGAKKFKEYAYDSYRVLMSEGDAKNLKQTWLLRFPEMRQFFALVSAMTQGGGGDIEQLFSGRRRGNVPYTAACNTFFQGLTADGAKRAMWYVQRECWTGVRYDKPLGSEPDSPLFGCRVVAFIHDEIIIEAPHAQAVAAAARLSEVMILAMKEFLPDIPVLADSHMMRRWYKEAAPCHKCKPCGHVSVESETMRCGKCGHELTGDDLVPWAPSSPVDLAKKVIPDSPLAQSWDEWDDDSVREVADRFKDKDIIALFYQYMLELDVRQTNPDPWGC